jgi:hypothetical protein
VTEAFDEDGKPKNPATDIALAITLDDLSWFANALGRARAEGELLPARSGPRSGRSARRLTRRSCRRSAPVTAEARRAMGDLGAGPIFPHP